MGSVIGFIVSLVVGAAIGTATIVGVVSSQTSPPDQSPSSVEDVNDDQFVEYGATD